MEYLYLVISLLALFIIGYPISHFICKHGKSATSLLLYFAIPI